MKTETRTKNIFDYAHVKGVRAVALLKNGKSVGRIIANFSDNPAGSVCTAQVMLWDDVIAPQIKQEHVKTKFLDCHLAVSMIGRAGGYGYDKFSSAIGQALRKGGISHLIKVGEGCGNEESAFKEAGFDWVSVC